MAIDDGGRKADGSGERFTIRTSFEGGGEEMDAAVYLFDARGALLATQPLKQGQASLSVDAPSRGMRLFVGPTLDKAERTGPVSLATMERISAFEPGFKFVPGREVYDLPPIPELIWPHWPLCRCRVRGHVVVRRRSASGIFVERPVCNARVHICEVDRLPWIIERLPDREIFRLRDEVIALIRHPLPWPPEPDPNPFDEIDPRVVTLTREEQRAQLQSQVTRLASRGDLVSLNPQPLPPVERQVQSLPAGLPIATQFALASQSVPTVRRVLLDQLDLIRPWICRWPWFWPWLYRSDEVRVVATDDDGRFDTTIWYLCAGDKPDLYFWVEYPIGGVWTTVYRPPIACHVWWDYACGTDVTITVTDPRVPGCGEPINPPGKQIIVNSIGESVSMGEISRAASGSLEGTVQAGWIDAVRESPFGATLEPRIGFGTALKSAGVTHYRWSQRPLGSGLDFATIEGTVTRHYVETPAVAGDPPTIKPFTIGPAPGVAGYFVVIDPDLPPDGVDWEVTGNVDLASAQWDTTGLTPGKYELKLELFRNVGGAMTLVNLTDEGIGVFEIASPLPSAGLITTATAADDRIFLDGGKVVGYRLVLHIDNRLSSGTIESVSVAPGANDTKCGFLEYGPSATATIVFRASHPANYASFSFDVSRVATLLPSASADGLVDAAAVNGFGRSGDVFSKALPVSTLLNEGLEPGETPCTRAAFAEGLHVYALATDGYGRLSYLDAPNGSGVALRGFAITPV
jgi:hypothetical protein